ncbi:MAG: SAM-dependent methyltransferase [Acidobacteriia bacterium]|nr:SAM-dependent methyltransferase [Terriglobia bacterium]
MPLSQSVIWRLQRDFYAQRGLKAWTEDMVPSYITNNPFIAEIYAGIVAGFLDDCMQSAQGEPLSAEHPLRIMELGAGTGRFSYLFLRKVTALLRAKNVAPELLRYRMSDCSESLIAEWRANRYLGEFVDSGILEFELLPAGVESQSPSAGGNASPSAKAASGPLVVIANYVFDSLPQDAFIIEEGKISEALVTTTGGSEAGGVQPLGNLQFSFANASVSPERYADKSWNEMLEQYRLRLPAATVLFPCAALALLQQLGQSSDGRMLLLAADKGITHEEDLALCQGPPALEFHASNHCFSQIVNFDAIAKYFACIGGLALVPTKHFTGLSICAFLGRRPGDELPSTRKAYEANLAAFGPDDLFALMTWLNAHLEEVSVSQALSLLRLTRWDTTAFLRLFPVIVRQFRNVTGERTDLRDAVLNTWANHYPVTPAENVLAFNCGVILLELRYFEDALAMFKTSEQFFGRSAATSYNLGLCAMGLGRADQALAFLTAACTQDPAFEPARNLRLKLEQEQAQR